MLYKYKRNIPALTYWLSLQFIHHVPYLINLNLVGYFIQEQLNMVHKIPALKNEF